MGSLSQKRAIAAINKNGALLVFPLKNQKEPKSIWSEFFPRTKMRWEWDDDGDDRVGQMWRLMKKLSDCRQVVYSKWYQGRATFFSRELFTAMLAEKMSINAEVKDLSPTAKRVLDVLEQDSPLSTKIIKLETDLQGIENEGPYNRALKELFRRLLVVGFGEVDDGAFPSLAIGATRLIYEDLWQDAVQMSTDQAQATIEKWLPGDSAFGKFWRKS